MIELAQLRAELEMEKRHLQLADADLAAGRARFSKQLALLASLQDSGHNSVEAERLADLLQDTLRQWEQHRALIAERLTYLENQLANQPATPAPPKTSRPVATGADFSLAGRPRLLSMM